MTWRLSLVGLLVGAIWGLTGVIVVGLVLVVVCWLTRPAPVSVEPTVVVHQHFQILHVHGSELAQGLLQRR